MMRLPIFYVIVFSLGLLSVISSAVLIFYNVFYLAKVEKPSVPPIISSTYNPKPINTPTKIVLVNDGRPVPEIKTEGLFVYQTINGVKTLVSIQGLVTEKDGEKNTLTLSLLDKKEEEILLIPPDAILVYLSPTVNPVEILTNPVIRDKYKITFDDIEVGNFVSYSPTGKVLIVRQSL